MVTSPHGARPRAPVPRCSRARPPTRTPARRSFCRTLQELRIVIVAGMVAEVGCALVMFTFSDKAALGSQAGTAQVAAAADAPLPAEVPLLADVPAARTAVALPPDALSADAVAPDEAASVDEVGAAGEEETGANGSEHAPAPEDEASGEAEADGAPAAVLPAPDDSAPVVCAPPPPRLAPGAAGVAASAASARAVARVPYILFASSLLSALGSGCTVKFFPLFFKQVRLRPLAVSLSVSLWLSLLRAVAASLGARGGALALRGECAWRARPSALVVLLPSDPTSAPPRPPHPSGARPRTASCRRARCRASTCACRL